MSGRLITIAVDGSETETWVPTHEPDLDTLQRIVGGLIQEVPQGIKYEGENRLAFCNDNGRNLGLALNEKASAMWLAALGPGPFWYTPDLRGAVAVWVPEAHT